MSDKAKWISCNDQMPGPELVGQWVLLRLDDEHCIEVRVSQDGKRFLHTVTYSIDPKNCEWQVAEPAPLPPEAKETESTRDPFTGEELK